VKELVFLPPNGGAGYPLGTGAIFAAPPSQRWADFSDNYYNLVNRAAALRMETASDGTVTVESTDGSFSQQYQILLNIGTDTYRICNRANERCLEVANGSLSSGAEIRETDYLALPYQQWRRVVVGSYSKFVNVYSGLYLTANGTGTIAGGGVVQLSDNASNAQQWSIPYVTHFPKKGSSRSEVSGDFVEKYNASHWYGWGLYPEVGGVSTSNDPTHFIPMWWNNRQDRTADMLLRRAEWAVSDVPKYLMGFNEPNHSDQANMSVQTALNEWSRAEQVNLPLIGPQHDYAWGSWYTSFFDQADAMGARIDEGGGHIYPTSSSVNYDSFNSGVTDGYNAQNGRLQWVTEWNWVNWGGAATWTDDQLYSVVAETLWRYENNPWVKRHEFFAFSAYWANGAPGALQKDGNILPLGRLYSAWDGDLTTRENTWYNLHNRGYNSQLQNNAGAPGLTSINTVDSSINWYLAPAGGGKYFIVSYQGLRLSSDGTNVSLSLAGTTGTAVEWILTPVATAPAHYGWYYLEHPASGKRLDSANGSTFAMTTDTDNSPRWRFIKAYHPASVATQWLADQSGLWSEGAKWLGGSSPPGGLGATADFSTLNIASDRTITLDASRSVGALKFGDTSGSQKWTLSSSGGSVLTLDAQGNTPAIVVNQNTATISASIAGANGFIKSGSGTLLLSGANSYRGETEVVGGVIAVTNNTALGGGPLSFTINTGGVGKLQVSNDISLANPINVNGSASGSPTTGVIESTGNNTLKGNITWNTTGGVNTSFVSQSGTLSLNGDFATAGSVTGTRILNLGGAGDLIFNGDISDGVATLSLVKGGNGKLTLSGINSHSGSTTVTAGILAVTSEAALGSGSLSFTDTSAGLGKLQVSNNITISNSININGSASGSTTSGVIESTGNNTLNGAISWNTTGGANASIVSQSGLLTLSGNITPSGSVIGSRALNLGGAGNILVNGSIINGTATLSLIKGGTGLLTLAGVQNFTGPTTVSSGTLLINGSTAGSATTVANGASLGGGGTAGAVNIQAGGSINPGSSGVGTLSIGDTILSGTLAIDVASAASSDRLNVSGNVTLGGTLAISAPAGLPAGTVFTIINKTSAGSVSGTFAGNPQDSLFIASGNTWIVSYTGGDGNDVTLTVATAQQQWQWDHFGADWNNPAVAGELVDLDGDGAGNLLERAFGGDPNVFESGLLPAVDPSAPLLSIVYRKSKAATDLTVTVQESADLAGTSWAPATGTSTLISDNGTVEIIRFTSPAAGATKKFIRTSVTTGE
jgi:autotransporter-associated beta strand protein